MFFCKTRPFVIEIAGGLGNQMFQYAFYLSFKESHPHTQIDISSYITDYIHNGFELDKVFNIHELYCSKDDLIALKDLKTSLAHKIKRKLIGRHPSVFYEHNIGYNYKPGIFNLKKPTILQGCWLSENYFKNIEPCIREAFVFAEFSDKKNIQLYNQIKNRNSVSVHIRRGDYLSSEIHKGICGDNYYKNAIMYFSTSFQNPLFLIFSDDSLWCKENISFLKNTEHLFVDWNKKSESYRDMQLMSYCKHNIIANSTFSWWGAWLNPHKGKKIIAPKKWFNHGPFNADQIIPNTWFSID